MTYNEWKAEQLRELDERITVQRAHPLTPEFDIEWAEFKRNVFALWLETPWARASFWLVDRINRVARRFAR